LPAFFVSLISLSTTTIVQYPSKVRYTPTTMGAQTPC
jgi:hypothetical protein